MLPSIAASSSGHWNQDGSRKWQRAIARLSSRTQTSTSPRKPSAKRQSFAGAAVERGRDRPVRQTLENLFDKRQALLDLADAHPDASVDVALRQYRNDEVESS